MGNRIIKESICTSENIDALTYFEEAFFYRLIVNCDDYGRMDARAKILKARLFPLKQITEEQIAAALASLQRESLIILYHREGRPYIQLRTWSKHQNIRAKKSKYPEPDGSEILSVGEYEKRQIPTDEFVSEHLNSNEYECPRNPIQSNTNSNPNTNTNPIPQSGDVRRKETDLNFDKFWKEYPRKVGKEAAKRAFAKVKVPVDTLLAALQQQKASEQWKRGYIPNPATWLNQGRWEDEVETKDKPRRPFVPTVFSEVENG